MLYRISHLPDGEVLAKCINHRLRIAWIFNPWNAYQVKIARHTAVGGKCITVAP